MDDEISDLYLFPLPVEVEAGKVYGWCGCGESKTQPWCDKSHSTCNDESVSFKARLDETLYFCSCKKTHSPPFCDGSHASLLLARLKQKGLLDG